MLPASAVAKQIRERLAGTSGHKLHKLLYYCQVWSLAWHDAPLFPDEIFAWRDGPVAPSVRVDMLYSNSQQVQASPAIRDEDVAHIDRVLVMYGHMTPNELVALTQGETPWKNARMGLPDGSESNVPMPPNIMSKYYKAIWQDAEATNHALNEAPAFTGSVEGLFETFAL